MKNESKTSGYVHVKLTGQTKTAHFGMNFLKNILDDGQTLKGLGQEMTSGEGIDMFIGMSKVLYYGFKAYDAQNGIDIDYNEEKCLEWTLGLDDAQIKEFTEALTYATALNEGISKMGKKKQEKSLQN